MNGNQIVPDTITLTQLASLLCSMEIESDPNDETEAMLRNLLECVNSGKLAVLYRGEEFVGDFLNTQSFPLLDNDVNNIEVTRLQFNLYCQTIVKTILNQAVGTEKLAWRQSPLVIPYVEYGHHEFWPFLSGLLTVNDKEDK